MPKLKAQKIRLENLAVALLIIAIALSPSLSAGEIAGGRIIEIKAEDILLAVLGLVWIVNTIISRKTVFYKPPLFLPICVWLGIGFVSVLLNLILGNVALGRAFFYFLKEIEFFFLYFYIFYHIRSIHSVRFIISLWIVLALANVFWVIYNGIKGIHALGYYGPGAIGDPAVYPSGLFFLLLFIFLFSISIFYELIIDISKLKKVFIKVLIIAMAFTPAIGVFSSCSRASFVGFIFAVFLILFIFLIRKGIFKSLSLAIFIFIFISIVLVSITRWNIPLYRFLDIESGIYSLKVTRMEKIGKVHLHGLDSPLSLLLGLGKSHFQVESHSQYVRNIVETGILGSLAFFILIFSIIRKAYYFYISQVNSLSIGLCSGLLVATLTMLVVSIPGEAFLVVKPDETYWSFTALTFGACLKSRKYKLSPQLGP